MPGPPIDALRTLLNRSAVQVAPALLGWRLLVTDAEGTAGVELTEVEAYDGPNDPASHSYRGETPRNTLMFGPPGRLYVYFSYGMHWCANIVCGPPGTPSAVLLRAGRVVTGEQTARGRRGPAVPARALARGPATLTRALGVTGADNGADLLSGSGRLQLRPPSGDWSPGDVSSGPRVGVSAAADRCWRFWMTGDETVSAYRRNPRAPSSR